MAIFVGYCKNFHKIRTGVYLKKKIIIINNMKKILSAIIFGFVFLTGCNAFAADDFWDEPMKIDEAAKTQEKSVTNQEFEKVMQFFERKKKKKEEKKKPKGAPLWEQNVPDAEEKTPSNDISGVLKNIKEDYPTAMLPVTLITPQMTEIPPGYYRILSAKNDYGYFINFYQGNQLIAKVKAQNTGNDHNQKSLNYAKLIPFNDEYMKVIYGDIDCNLEARLLIKQ